MTFYLGLDLGQAQDFTAISVLELQRVKTGRQLPLAMPAIGIIAARGRKMDDQPEVLQHELVMYDETIDRYMLRYLERPELNTPYPDIVQRVKALLQRPQLAGAEALVIDATGVGRAVLDMFIQARLPIPIVPISITGGNTVSHDPMTDIWNVPKRDLVGVLNVMMQNHELHMPSEEKAKKLMPLAIILKAECLNFKAKINLKGHDSYEAGNLTDWREGAHDDLVLSVAMACWYVVHVVNGGVLPGIER